MSTWFKLLEIKRICKISISFATLIFFVLKEVEEMADKALSLKRSVITYTVGIFKVFRKEEPDKL